MCMQKKDTIKFLGIEFPIVSAKIPSLLDQIKPTKPLKKHKGKITLDVKVCKPGKLLKGNKCSCGGKARVSWVHYYLSGWKEELICGKCGTVFERKMTRPYDETIKKRLKKDPEFKKLVERDKNF